MSKSLEFLKKTAFLFSCNDAYIENLYEDFLRDPNAVDPVWRTYFETCTMSDAPDISHTAIKEKFLHVAKEQKKGLSSLPGSTIECDLQAQQQAHLGRFIDAYRAHGHHIAQLDPLQMKTRTLPADLTLAYHSLDKVAPHTLFFTNSFHGFSEEQASLQSIVDKVKRVYAANIGIEFMHISDPAQLAWIQERMETTGGEPRFSVDEKKEIFQQLLAAETLEHYLGQRYVGQKRFSLEGSDALIPLLNDMVNYASASAVNTFVIGMAHRGRLNVLINVLGKSPEQLFQEFEGLYYEEDRTGDVKYHLGFASDIEATQGKVHLALGFNPSHLEIITPVVIGAVRAKQEIQDDEAREKIIPIAIHGDAAFAGQGVVMETFNMSQARGYCIGGTVHIVINNQIGFTTSNPLDSRSTLYCTDVAKMVQAPILHVNADDPESVVFAGRFALDFRRQFKRDVVIDLVSYRRHGHNESDEPSMTQPLMYRKIKAQPTALKLYTERLVAANILKPTDLPAALAAYKARLDAGKTVVKLASDPSHLAAASPWEKYCYHTLDVSGSLVTAVNKETLFRLGQALLSVPDDFSVQAQVQREWNNRAKMLSGEQEFFWGMAELLAYASLLQEGYVVRLSGQDSGRGTFSHRHAVLHDYKTGEIYVPLNHLSAEQAKFTVIDSVLSEEAVLAFEYGYSTTDPNRLVIWEAQFGDFFNGAQVVIDQFLSSGEQKWGKLSGLVLYLPHGYEGMGPEHSSARLERFLQLCAQHNMQVCVPTTPAQMFHLIRQQMLAPYRKPLVVMTPKSLLRHKQAVSTWSDLTEGRFMPLLTEKSPLSAEKIKRIILCSGKVYYELAQYRTQKKQDDVLILRVESLYPFPDEPLSAVLQKYPQVETIVWCQEEPKNQGAWQFVMPYLQTILQKGQKLRYAGRMPFAAPAVGYHSLHQKQQTQLIEEAFSCK